MPSNLQVVKLEKLVFGGDALGRLPDGRVILVPFALPGETVQVKVKDTGKDHVRAEVEQVLESSSSRIQPACRHFTACGGCHYQHLSYQDQCASKESIFLDQLSRLGHLAAPKVNPIVRCPAEWNYRNHVQFHLDREGRLGYLDKIGESVIAIQECHLPEGALNSAWPRLEFETGLPLERISLRLGMHDEILLVLEGGGAIPPELQLEADFSVVHRHKGETLVLAGSDRLRMATGDHQYIVSAASFFQVNTHMAAKMVDHLLAYLPVNAHTTLLDVYCGVGLFSLPFAPLVKRLIGIEASPSACDDFTINLDPFDNVELYQASAAQVLPQLDVKPDAVIVDPPRAGLDKTSLNSLLDMAPAQIAYVSCDPSTLARDAARLNQAGYQLLQTTPFDLFPQTFHIESISIFARE
jgi:23S rRNA (uracil1939-C5)-methyltransferase